jgi:hypothetical protein
MAEAKSGDGERTGATPVGAEEPATAPAAAEPAEKAAQPVAEPAAEEPAGSSAKAPTMAATKAPAGRSDDDRDAKGSRGSSARRTVDSVRSAVATLVWVIAVLAALVLAAGALVVSLDFNDQNGVVKFLTETAGDINFLGKLKDFKPDRGPKADDAMTKEVLVNWGLCAVAYLVGGKILDKVIRP